jgi:cytochrome o ubiquinol oxidase subunit 2
MEKMADDPNKDKTPKPLFTLTKATKPVFFMLIFSAIIFFFFLLMQPLEVLFYHENIAIIFPNGPIAAEQRNLLLILQAMMLFVIFPVYILTFIFSWWYRADNTRATYDPDLVDHRILEYVWWGFPFLMVAIASVLTWYKTHELDPYKPIESDKKPIIIEAVALQWKWLFIYPEEKIATVNYLQIPVDRPIHFLITADAPMNSLWIPNLGGQIYAMPGMRTELYLVADEGGQFQGVSANISGEGFADMHFETKADSEEEYEKWIKSAKESKNSLDLAKYQELAAPSKSSVEIYQLKEENLFNQIIMKFMHPINAATTNRE